VSHIKYTFLKRCLPDGEHFVEVFRDIVRRYLTLRVFIKCGTTNPSSTCWRQSSRRQAIASTAASTVTT